MKVSTLRSLLIRYGVQIGLKHNEMILLWHLLDFDHTDKGCSYPTEKTIAVRMGLKNVRNVRLILNSLIKKRMLSITTKQLKPDLRKNNYSWTGLKEALLPHYQIEIDQSKKEIADQKIPQLHGIADQKIPQLHGIADQKIPQLSQNRGSKDPMNSYIYYNKKIVPKNGTVDSENKFCKKSKHPMNRKEFIAHMKLGKSLHLNIIATYADRKQVSYDAAGEWWNFMNRNLKPAGKLAEYKPERLKKAYNLMMTKWGKSGGKWTLETLLKYLDDASSPALTNDVEKSITETRKLIEELETT